MGLALTLHVLSAAIWVGGMFFAYLALRPSLQVVEAPLRMQLWDRVLGRFFAWVRVFSITLLITGFYMIHVYGGMAKVPPSVHVMMTLGIVMVLLFFHLSFAPFRRLHRAVAANDQPTGLRALQQIRWIMATNLTLGLIVIAVAVGGRFVAGV